MKNSTFQLIDFDRTLFNTTLLIEALLETIEHDDAKLSNELRKQSEQAYKEERTFLLLRYLREYKGDAWLEALVREVVNERGAEAFMLPGAKERLEAADQLSTTRPGWGILTYGDPVDQLMKLRLAGLDKHPFKIVTEADKGGLIASWRTEDGAFHLPEEFGGVIVDRLTFEDDKLSVFQGTPVELIGVWVTHREDARLRLAEAELPNVVIAKDLHESLEYLRQRLD